MADWSIQLDVFFFFLKNGSLVSLWPSKLLTEFSNVISSKQGMNTAAILMFPSVVVVVRPQLKSVYEWMQKSLKYAEDDQNECWVELGRIIAVQKLISIFLLSDHFGAPEPKITRCPSSVCHFTFLTSQKLISKTKMKLVRKQVLHVFYQDCILRISPCNF